MRRLGLLAALAAALGAAPAASAGTLSLQPVGTFSKPTNVVSFPGDPDHLLVAQQNGIVKEVAGGVVQPTPWLDVSSLISFGASTPERGLLGLAFDPGHPDYVYVDYTAASDGAVTVAQFHVDTAAGAIVAGSRKTVVTVAHSSAANHNGGQLAFGPGDDLFVGIGDGDPAGDPNGHAQDVNTWLGKILRLDPDRTNGGYTVPAGNPIAGSPVWAYGLRNPWRFSFDRSTGDLVIADVGQSTSEEIDFAPLSGGGPGPVNYGWSCYEGFAQYSANWSPTCSLGGPTTSATSPILAYGHSSSAPSACSITGGYVVRDPGLPSLVGRYVFGDYCGGWVKSALLATPAATDVRGEPGLATPSIVSFGEDATGRLYTVSGTGAVSRVVESAPPAPPPPPAPAGPPAAPGATPPPAPGAAASRDATPPLLRLTAAPRQRLLRDGAVGVLAGCSEPCRVRARAWLRIAGHARALALGPRSAPATATATLTWRLPAPRRRSVARALRAHRRVRVTFSAGAQDSAGNAAAARAAASAIVG